MNEIIIRKNADIDIDDPDTPDEGELELISAYTRKRFAADELYTFTVTLCDNEIDRDYERFSLSAINTLKEMFVGVTGIFDHSMKSSDQTARIYKTEVVTDNSAMTTCGEPYTRLKARCYMLRNEKNKELISEIDAGIKKETSISCSASRRICSVCGNDIRGDDCDHFHGEVINGKVCHAVICEPTDAYEWSFVAVPAQKNAGVSKSAKIKAMNSCEPEEIVKSLSSNDESITLNYAQMKKLSEYIEDMKSHAQSSLKVRNEAQREIIALSAYTLPDTDTQMMSGLIKKLSDDEVFMLRTSLRKKAEESGAFMPAFRSETVKDFNNSQFKI